MNPADIKIGDVLSWREERYKVIRSEVSNEFGYVRVTCECALEAHDVMFHFPVGKPLPEEGPEVWSSEGDRCESCETFLHEDDRGAVFSAEKGGPGEGSLFCSRCRS